MKDSPSTQNVPLSFPASGSALARAAWKAARLAADARDADAEFTRLMHERYGEFDEIPDSLVEAIRYGWSHKHEITVAFIDQCMKDELNCLNPTWQPQPGFWSPNNPILPQTGH